MNSTSKTTLLKRLTPTTFNLRPLKQLGLGFALFVSSASLAQQPLYLPDDIPLDFDEIYQELHPEEGYSQTTQNIIKALIDSHYSDIVLDDEFSTKLLDSFIETLDISRIYFTADDIQEFEQYRHSLDENLNNGDLEAGYLIYNRYQKRIIQRLLYSLKRVEEDQSEFDFTIDENIIVDRADTPWVSSESELEDLWRKRVKSSVLSARLAELEEAEDDTPLEEPEEATDIREELSDRFRTQLSQVLKTNNLDVYQRYMDALTMTFDPHTQYFAPRAAENFNMNMRLSLEGIGAVLSTEDEYTKVVSIVSGGPADLEGELQPSDRITAVAQAEGEFVDIVGWRVDDVVQLIRGAKGSIVRLNVIPESAENDMERRIIKITRDTVKLEDQSAKKEIVEVDYEGQTYKIGVIELPTFYIDFEALQRRDPNYRSSTRDVKNLLAELTEEGVDGVVVDLRRNGGGSLSEANSLVGLFIRRGPTVQVRDADGNNIVQGDADPEVAYNGPLGVLVNRLSASASEIFAGAIQDYQRGVILGGQTFGKGTVQELIPMRTGQMKITRAKFYRISGESTQHKGVTPDISFPDLYSISEDIGESALDTALPWDTIEANYYRPYSDLTSLIPILNESHLARIENDPEFDYIRAQIARAEENKDRNELTLNEAKLIAEREENEAWSLSIENSRLIALGKDPISDLDELNDEDESDEQANSDSDSEDFVANSEDEDDEENEDSDPYLIESGKVLLDLLRLQNAEAFSLAGSVIRD